MTTLCGIGYEVLVNKSFQQTAISHDFGREIKGNEDMHSERASGSITTKPTNRSTSASQTNQSGQQLPQTASHNKLASQLSSQLAGW